MSEQPHKMEPFLYRSMNINEDMIAIISDVHANLPAFQAVLDNIKDQGITKIVALGDNVGYYPWVKETYEIFQDKHIFTILGNHDFALVETTLILREAFSNTAREVLEWSQQQVTGEIKKWILGMPLRVILNTPNASLLLIHGHPNRPFEYFYSYSKETLYDMIREELDRQITTGILVGHTHIPLFHKLEATGKFFLNPGSVGQPRDKNPFASYAIFDTEKNTGEIIRVKYDISVVEEEIKRLHLPDDLWKRLYQGR